MPLRRFRAPTGNGEILAEPGFDAVRDLVAENRRRLNRDDIRISDWWDGTLGRFRNQARTITYIQVLDYLGRPLPYKPGTVELEHIPTVSDDAPLIVSGHQPDLFHPGVWAKNFALSGIARKLGGVGLNLIVDNDTAKAAAVRVPVASSASPEDVRASTVPFDASPDLPYEEYRVQDPNLFATFADRVEAALPPSIGEPLLQRAWEEVRCHPDQPVGEAFARARRMLEREWGCDNLELPVSRLAGTELFLQFLFNICSEAERFAEIHNAAVADFRRRHGIRSRSHPVPDLAKDGDWQETPFWAWNERATRRGRVWVRKAAGRITFRFDNGLADVDVPLPFRGYGPDHISVMNAECKLRPRALMLTLFARVCLGDFFLHGIGGGKYDEVTDAIIRNYFGIEPPAYQVVSATLHLPLPAFPSTDEDLATARRRLRDLQWNPQRNVVPPSSDDRFVMRLVADRESLAASEPPPGDRAARREWYRKLADLNEQLRHHVWKQVPPAKASLARFEAEVQANAVLRRRDYSWVLFPEETLRPFLQQFLHV